MGGRWAPADGHEFSTGGQARSPVVATSSPRQLSLAGESPACRVRICETTKALVGDDSVVEVVAVDDRWLARTTMFTGRCKATTLIR
jgi:hypothetical protein